ncbi:NADP-dependent oxidoreductase [Cellulomonas wangsupingiae]|uniref:NADP-dependent oxidoreductase n=1 Tax=Cellulomonas wangsupingiae TaxID=2968085 RepID=A0ABY5K7M4_9CELL|nr:NADP-dependent oxidoreductase [Cellulomonas wangsupingiae]MCC2333803.1 NADP-dependent oxidoreductase [Cellulomonas wangsupingiae]MCM0639377.1 NADP-dependent oxidoreductase [Cellulomonas wangsupingiae]UUI65065.1 NADP-dependent oxidoreductase [Cellulomonas wangsupingiae]
MRAVRFHRYGDPQVLTLEEAPEPHAGPGQVRIRVHGSSVNPVDWKVRAGYLHEMMPVTFPATPGSDAAGVVDEVGEGVTGVSVGDAVFGLAQGGAAELAVLTAWAPVPRTWSMTQAAAAGLVAATATAGLDALGDLSGRTVLIEGAAGGVGSAAVEIAVARGATVVGTASEANHEYLRELGAVPVTYGPGLADRVAAVAPQGVDAVLDTAGSGSLADLVTIAGDPSRVATVADFGAAALGVALVQGGANAAVDLPRAAELGTAGAYTPRVEATYPADRAADAHAHVQGGHTRGKVVVTF